VDKSGADGDRGTSQNLRSLPNRLLLKLFMAYSPHATGAPPNCKTATIAAGRFSAVEAGFIQRVFADGQAASAGGASYRA
jgi:hypothetical protein